MISTSSKLSGCFLGLAIGITLAGCQGMKSSSNPTPTAVTVTLTPSAANLGPGATTPFTATVANTSNTAVTWSVDSVAGGNATVGTISGTGMYTAPATAGTHTVTATSVADSTANAKATVTVGVLSLTPASALIAPSGTQQFTATIQGFTNTAVTWSVDTVAGGNATTGTITSAGLYTAPATAGSHTVTATSAADTSLTSSAAVTVAQMSVSPATAFVAPAGTQQFTATIPGSPNATVTWAVDQVSGGNATVGTITAGGLYTAPAQPGGHTVTATNAADTTVSASATVSVVTLSVSPATVTMATSSTQQFTATATGATAPPLTWSVDTVVGGNATVGTITTTGLYTSPTQTGNHTISAAITGFPAITNSATVSVFVFTVTPATATIAPSSQQQFTATIQGLNNTSVTWSVDKVNGGNSTTGTITAGGLYTAPAAIGAHVVTATSVQDPTVKVSAALTVINISQSSVLTYHNDDSRDGAYLEEVNLTPANVNSAQFGKLYSYPVDGQVYAQPLYLPQLSIAGGTHDVVFVETQNNSVYAFDADATSSLNAQTFWHVGLGPSVVKNDIYGVNPNVGILSTPVIDTTTNTMYLVVETSNTGPNGTPFFLHALDVTTGADKFGGPVAINGSVPGTGDENVNGTVSLGTDCYQRMGLALNPVTNSIEIPFGSCAHGWVLAYDKASLKQTAIFNDTPDWQGGGFWSSDGAPAVDDTTGDVYLMSGVDTGDQNTNNLLMLYNDSFLHLNSTDLSVTSYFAPDDNYNLAVADADLGSGSNILVPGSSTVNVTLGGGKDGNVFVLNRDNMGGFNSGSNNVLQTVQICTNGDNNIFSTPVYWNGNIYFHCNGYGISAYSWSAATTQMSTTPTSTGSTVYTSHGATPSLSANGATNGIVWDIDNSNYSYKLGVPQGPSVLHAYNATNLANELYNSSQAANGRDTAGQALKFTSPTIANGKVFVPTSTELDIYGLLP